MFENFKIFALGISAIIVAAVVGGVVGSALGAVTRAAFMTMVCQ